MLVPVSSERTLFVFKQEGFSQAGSLFAVFAHTCVRLRALFLTQVVSDEKSGWVI